MHYPKVNHYTIVTVGIQLEERIGKNGIPKPWSVSGFTK